MAKTSGSKELDFKQILTANDNDGIAENDLVLVHWPERDLALLKDCDHSIPECSGLRC